MNAPQTWTVTPEQYAALEAEVNAAGYPISGNSGTAKVSQFGLSAKLGWTYDGTKLSITVLSAPPFCTGKVERKIAETIGGALALSAS